MKEPLSRGLWGVLATPFTADAARAVRETAPGVPLVIGLAERETRAATTSASRLLEAVAGEATAVMVQVQSPEPSALAEHIKIGLAIRKASWHERGVFASGAVRPPAPGMPDALMPVLRQHLAHIPLP
jgi:hypothetical protein